MATEVRMRSATALLRGLATSFGVLTRRDFRLLSTGQLISLLGDQFFLVALPFVLLSGRHDAHRLGAVLLCLGVARAVAVAFGGGLSDRFRQRTVMLGTDLTRLVLMAVLAVVVLTAHVRLLVIAALAACLGLAQGVFLPSQYSIVPQLVPQEEIVAANSITTALANFSGLVGPAIGGLLVAGVSPGAALVIDAATFGVSALCLAFIRGRAASSSSDVLAAAPPADLGYRAFLRYFRHSRLLLFSVTVTLIVNLGYLGMTEIALPALARARYANGPVAFGLLLTGSALGALAGAGTARPLLTRRRGALLALTAGIVEGTAILLVPAGPGFAASWVELFIAGLASAVGNVFFVSALQRTVPRQFLGRTMGLLILAAAATAPVSYGLVAVLVSAAGPPLAISFAGAATIAAFSVGFLSQEIRGLSLVPAETQAARQRDS